MGLLNKEEKKVTPFVELGVTGLKRTAGYVYEEFLKKLEGTRGIKIYREMSNNDSVIGGLLFAIEQIVMAAKWRIDAGGEEPADIEAQEFIEQCFDDMSFPMSELLSEILSMLPYGWAWFEIVYKIRGGDVDESERKSKFDDNKIGWRKFGIRSQDSLNEWVFGETGKIEAMVQCSPPDYQRTVIPMEKSLLFRAKRSLNNPEGRSVLRTCYRAWFFKKRIEELEAIGVERDLAGLPLAQPPEGVDINDTNNPQMVALKKQVETLVRQVRRDEQDGLVLPFGWTFTLLSAAGSRQFSTNDIIKRYDQRIVMSVLSQILLMGTDKVGSFALGQEHKNILLTAIDGWLNGIADVFNRFAIPKVFKLNNIKLKKNPQLAFEKLNTPDIAQLSESLSKLGGILGFIFPNEKDEKYLRSIIGLPPKPEMTPVELAEEEKLRRPQRQEPGNNSDNDDENDNDDDKGGKQDKNNPKDEEIEKMW